MDSTDQIARLLRASSTSRDAFLRALQSLLTERTSPAEIDSPPALDGLSDAELHHLARRALAAPYPLAPAPGSARLRLGHLLALTPRDRLRAVLLHPTSYAQPEIIEALLGHARRRPSAAPHHAHELAWLALLAAAGLPDDLDRYRHGALIDGHVARGNGRRLAGQLNHARQDFDQARRLLEVSGNPRQALDFHTHSAALAIERTDCRSALHHLDQAEHLAGEHGDCTRRAVLAIQRSRVAWCLGRLREAHRYLVQAEAESPEDPHVLLSVNHNRGLLLVDLDAGHEACALFERSAHLYREFRAPHSEVLKLSQAGRVARARGRRREAAAQFRAGQDAAAQIGLPEQAAILHLELAVCELSDGHSRKVDHLVRAAIPVLSACQLPNAVSIGLLRLWESPGEHLAPALRGLHACPTFRQAPAQTSLARSTSA